MLLPTIAIVGRPNVGKSRLFNRLVGKPISIVDPTAGVTRDRVLHEVSREDYRFDLVDTGGIGIVDEAKLEDDVELQVERAIGTADRIIFLTDVRTGIDDLDRRIAKQLRPVQDRVTLVVNKVDDEQRDADAMAFLNLGMGEPVLISAEQARGMQDLIDAVCAGLPRIDEIVALESAAAQEGRLKVCFAGRRNVGKSSLTNALLGEERVIVADHAGTTRDAIDVKLDTEGGKFLLIDTAGLRKKRQIRQDLEFYAACRTERAIGRADVIFLVLDAADEVGHVDKKLAHFCETAGKPVVLVINKWDIAAANGAERSQYEKWLRNRLPGLGYAPIHYTSAIDTTGVIDLLPLAQELAEEVAQRITTAELNKLLEAAVTRRRPRKVGPSYTKLYYATQADITPPTILVFVNRTDWIEAGYSRYLENYLRQRTILRRVPIRIVFKARSSKYHDKQDQRDSTLARNKGERRTSLILPKANRNKGVTKKPGGLKRRQR